MLSRLSYQKSYNAKRRLQQGRKKSSGLISKTTIFARASRIFVHFFGVVVVRHET